MSDEELFKEYKKGRRDAMALIYERHKERIYRLLYFLTGSIEDAEDLLQQTFLKAIKGSKKFKGGNPYSVKKWLTKIAINLARDNNRKKLLNIKALLNLKSLYIPEKDIIFEKVENDLTVERIIEILSTLPHIYREIISLIYMEGFSYEEAAELLNKPVGTIKSRVNYGLNLIRKKLGVEK